MVATSSTMLPLGTEAPDFELPDPAGKVYARDDFADAPALLVAFICNHCPYVKHIRERWSEVAAELAARGVAVVAVNSNDADAYPDDSPEAMVEEARRYGYTFPYLVDATQDVAKTYRAACTPDFFLFDGDRRLAYRGQFDDSRPRSAQPVTGADLLAAADAVLAGRPAPEPQHPSMVATSSGGRATSPTSADRPLLFVQKCRLGDRSAHRRCRTAVCARIGRRAGSSAQTKG